jgi:hypothetical protein
MFLAMTKKLFPICPLLAMLISCGKKAEDGNASEVRREDVVLPQSIPLEASATGAVSRKDHVYTIVRDGTVEIPAVISASGKTANLRVRLDMNVLDGEEEFHCYWLGAGLEYQLDKCENSDGIDLGLTKENIGRFKFPIDQEKIIKLSLEAAPTGTTVKARLSLSVTWI